MQVALSSNWYKLKVRRGDQGKFFKHRPKSSPRLKGPDALAQMPLSSNYYALKVQALAKALEQKSGSTSCLIAKLFQFSQSHPKPAFSEKVQKVDQGKFFNNHPKSSPRLKSLKALAQMALSSN